MGKTQTAYLNGEFIPLESAKVSIEDRGFLFGDGVYEVIRVYGGKPFLLGEHFQRLLNGLNYLEIPFRLTRSEVEEIVNQLIRRDGVLEGTVYIQVTRGHSPRNHAFPDDPMPTVVMFARQIKELPAAFYESGCSAITVPDNRFGLCFVKTIGLLPNVLAKEKAKRAGCHEAIFVRDGLITEGASSNVFVSFGETIYTHPLANILPGITRKVVISLAMSAGFVVKEEAVPLDEFKKASEVMITSTTMEVLPVTRVDGETVGDGSPGPVYKALRSGYQQMVQDFRTQATVNRLA